MFTLKLNFYNRNLVFRSSLPAHNYKLIEKEAYGKGKLCTRIKTIPWGREQGRARTINANLNLVCCDNRLLLLLSSLLNRRQVSQQIYSVPTSKAIFIN